MPDAPEHPIFASIYDRALASIERAGLGDTRRELLRGASGRTLELGAGTGANVGFYPDAVTELVLTEPDPHMARRLRERLEREPAPVPRVRVDESPAEELPYEDGSFDSAVSTLVLCTVRDPAAALAELRRVLAPGGVLLFVEHVRDPDSRTRSWFQDRLERPWGFFAGGCHPNRATGELIAEAGFRVERVDAGKLARAPALMKPMIRGAARRP